MTSNLWKRNNRVSQRSQRMHSLSWRQIADALRKREVLFTNVREGEVFNNGFQPVPTGLLNLGGGLSLFFI
jgi:hypothetical protein